MMLLSVAIMTLTMLRHRPAADLRPDRRRCGLADFSPALRDGIFVGGEYTGVVAYLLEGAPRRGEA